MKSYIDFELTLKNELIAKCHAHAKLRKHWGTETIDGVEVFKEKFRIWPGTDASSVRQVLRLFGISHKDITSNSMEGITALYLTFNHNKTATTDLTAEAMANVLERELPIDGEWRTFNINYVDQSDPTKFTGWSNQQVYDYVVANYTEIAGNSVTKVDGGDIVDEIIGMYIPLDDGTDFQVEIVSTSVTPIANGTSTYLKGKRSIIYTSGINVEYRYKRIGYLNDSSPIIVNILAEQDAVRLIRLKELQQSTAVWYSEEGSGLEKEEYTDILWYKNQMRTEVKKVLKARDYTRLITGSLDTTYDKKKTKWWKKILIIVIVLIVAYFTGGLAAGTAGAAAGGGIAGWGAGAWAAAFSAAALAFTAASMLLARSGEYEGASYIGRWAKIAGLAAMITGVTAAIQSAAAQVAKSSGTSQVATQAAAQGTVITSISYAGSTVTATTAAGTTLTATASTGQIIGQLVSSQLTSMTSSVTNMLSTGFKVANMVVGRLEKNKMGELNNMRNEVQAQNNELADMYDKNGNLAMDMIGQYTKQLVNDCGAYTDMDVQYGKGPMNILRPSFHTAKGLNIQVKELPRQDIELYKSYKLVNDIKV